MQKFGKAWKKHLKMYHAFFQKNSPHLLYETRIYIYICNKSFGKIVQPAGAIEYTDSISAVGKNSSNECPAYNIKQSYGTASVMQALWGMWSTRLLSSLLGQLWPGVVIPDSVRAMSQKGLNCVLMLN